MELGKRDGKLMVHYNDRLVTLLREVRQLAALGFSIPGKIQAVAKTAQKFYRQGVILKQVRGVLASVSTINKQKKKQKKKKKKEEEDIYNYKSFCISLVFFKSRKLQMCSHSHINESVCVFVLSKCMYYDVTIILERIK